ncbi:hypothetical protein TRM7615_02502 [Falsiruegeria mediterranea M17]|uniref:Uncharacterized protein n=1 Tax=Falsiruegeria mediterranea M17 TaxID=1200281 RepID=A0A2R8C999_9RHOB|nr:hypothetical protein TRM7615_02502 [Falsiruegeria mediterranea M17]
MQTYGYAKLVATLWMGAMARQHPYIRLSP